MVEQENDFYQRLRSRIKDWLKTEEGAKNKWSEYLMFAPDLFHLLVKLSIDKRVPIKEKAKLAVAIAYFVSPIDILPEALIGPMGFLDDIALAAYVLNSVIKNTDPELVRQYWAGEGDVLDVIQKILNAADKMIGSGLWNKITGMF
jgi:uncharacterized membrane protein YkvA (DUF1232 family)